MYLLLRCKGLYRCRLYYLLRCVYKQTFLWYQFQEPMLCQDRQVIWLVCRNLHPNNNILDYNSETL